MFSYLILLSPHSCASHYVSLVIHFVLMLEGAQMAQSRYLFAISCFQMDLLSEAETALCPASEPSVEVQNIIQNIF